MKILKKTIAKLLGNTERTVENWEKEDRLILILLNRYISEEMAQELIRTRKIRTLDSLLVGKESKDIEEHILFHALRKIKDIPNLFLIGKKEFWLKGFLKVLEDETVGTKYELIEAISNLDQKFYEASHWKKITNDFITKNFSEYEMEIILLNRIKAYSALTDTD